MAVKDMELLPEPPIVRLNRRPMVAGLLCLKSQVRQGRQSGQLCHRQLSQISLFKWPDIAISMLCKAPTIS